MDISRATALRFFLFPVAAALLLLLAACEPPYRPGRGPVRVDSAPQGIPSWVLQPPLDAEYVFGVGTDLRHDRTRAIAEGQRDIARQLHIVISGDEQDGDDVEIEEDDTISRPRVVIDHLEIPGITVTREVSTTHCLYVQVALNRTAWATSLRNRLTEIDRDLTTVLANHARQPEIDATLHPIGSAARLHQRLRPLVEAREEKLSYLMIAQPGSIYPAAPITSADLRERLRQVLDRVTVDLVAAPDLEPILPQLTATCAGIGMRITPGAAKPTLRMKLTLASSTKPIEGMERLEGVFQSSVETGDGILLGTIVIRLRTSSLTQTTAQDRLMRKILVRWAEYIEKDLITHLTRL